MCQPVEALTEALRIGPPIWGRCPLPEPRSSCGPEMLSIAYPMPRVLCPPQVGAWASRTNGLVTVAPRAGAETCTPPPTSKDNVRSHREPLLPQDFTWRACKRSDALRSEE